MGQFHIRPATPGDAGAISRIYNDAVLTTTATYDYEPEPLERREAWMEDHASSGLPVLVAEGSAGVLGWASLSPFHRRPGFRFTVENSIYVDAPHRGRGIGKALLAALIPEASRLGLRCIIAAVDASNETSLQLHRAFGFVDVGRFPAVGFKFDRWLDVAYLQLSLPAATPAVATPVPPGIPEAR